LQEKILREIQFQAGVHGAELKNVPEKKSTKKQSEHPNVPLFGDPEEYSHLSAEDRQKKTDEMMARHKNWSSDPLMIHTKRQGL